MKERGKSYFELWKEDFMFNKRKLVLSLIFVIIAIVLNFISSSYAQKVAESNPPDFFLNILPAVDLGFIYVWLPFVVVSFFFVYPLVQQPRRFHYIVGIFSLFLVVHSGFVVLTHLELPADAIELRDVPFFFDFFYFSNSLFFAGQVGFPYLGYLIYYKNPSIRKFMLFSSIILSVTVLLMHRHYSIDVLSAYFITYGAYKLGDFIFKD